MQNNGFHCFRRSLPIKKYIFFFFNFSSNEHSEPSQPSQPSEPSVKSTLVQLYRTRLLVLSRSLRYDIHCPSAQVDFSTDGRELTPTMKMARHAVLKKYAAEVCTNPLLFNASLRDDEILFKLISNFTSSISRWRRCTVESSTVTAFTAAASPNDQPRDSSNQTWQKIIAQYMDTGKRGRKSSVKNKALEDFLPSTSSQNVH